MTQILSCSTFPLAPNSPTNVEITGIDSYSIRVTWSPPDMSNCTDVDAYRITCFDSCRYSRVGNRSHSLNTTIQYSNSVSSCVFSCCVSGNNSAGVGPQNCVYGRECLYKYCDIPVLYWMYSFPHPSKKHDSPVFTNFTTDWVDGARTRHWAVLSLLCGVWDTD